ncbi:hypothetical protein VTO73DRAFT_13851 [Trametes versicolor]
MRSRPPTHTRARILESNTSEVQLCACELLWNAESFHRPRNSTFLSSPYPTASSQDFPLLCPPPQPLAATATATAHVLTSLYVPDPLPLLAHSMKRLRVLPASEVVFVVVTNKRRCPAVRELRLHIARGPIVTALAHAFPGIQKLYVYA